MLSTVLAYIDVGTGSYVLTAIAGGFATMWFFLRSKIDRLLGRRPPKESAEVETAMGTDASEVPVPDPKQE